MNKGQISRDPAVTNIAALVRNQMNGMDFDTLVEILKESGGVIAGSSVMQSLLNVSWDNIDIDLWIPSHEEGRLDGLQELTLLLNRSGYTQKVEQNTDREQYKRFEDYVESITTFFGGTNRCDVQIIKLRRGQNIRQMVKSFDIVASQFFFDGVRIIEVGENSRDDLWNGTITFSKEVLKIQALPEWLRTIRRVKKYMSRGFCEPSTEQWIKVIDSVSNWISRENSMIFGKQARIALFHLRAWNSAVGANDFPKMAVSSDDDDYIDIMLNGEYITEFFLKCESHAL